MRTATDTTLTTASVSASRDGPAQQAARFALHVLEMCAVMCGTLALLGLVVTAAVTALDITNPVAGAPAVAALVATVALAGSMTAWMRFRSMAWRPTLEMAGSTVAAGAVMLGGYAAGLVAPSDVVGGTCGLACLAMIAVMALRFRLYASHTSHHAHASR